MKLLVDGDSAGRRDAVLDLAEEFGVEVHWVCNSHQKPPMPEPGRGYKLFTYLADDHRDAADMKIMNLSERGDLVVTADLGLALVCVSKGCAALSPRGHWYKHEELAEKMEFRHLRAEVKRRGGQLGGGPPKARKPDEIRFEEELRHALEAREVGG
jgi:hypothetical protein